MAGSVLTYLDSYCERGGDAGAFAEPLNLITNGFFIIASVLVVQALRNSRQFRHPELVSDPNEARETRQKNVSQYSSQSIEKTILAQTRHDGCRNKFGMTPIIDLWLLALFLFAIGIGSGLWHWQPSQATLLMDVIPITLFMNLYLLSALRRLFRLSWRRVFCWWGLYVVLTFAGQKYLPPDMLHGTVMYLPTYAAMVALTFGVARRNRDLGKVFAIITTVWSLSLIARTVDLEICASLSIGTHFIWHTLNAWVLWRLLMVLVRRGA